MSKRARTIDHHAISETTKEDTPKKLKRAKTVSTTTVSLTEVEEPSSPSQELSSKASTNPKEPHIRDTVNPLPPPARGMKIISWNVNGLNAVVSKKMDVLEKLVKTHSPDILCFQETKLQWEAVSQYENLLPGYQSFWSCSTVKKGYSGTAIFLKTSTINTAALVSSIKPTAEEDATKLKKKQSTLTNFFGKKGAAEKTTEIKETAPSATILPQESSNSNSCGPLISVVSMSRDFEDLEKSHHGEGRTFTIEFDRFILLACYVPNSGEGLVRLNYRINEWDPFVKRYLQHLRETKHKPVIYTGDLNVGHLDLDIHNPEAKHIVKQAGLTPQERASFTDLLAATNFTDAFRYFYPQSRGQFTYWSQRTFARPVNRGIRLDYFLCSPDLFPSRHKDSSNRDTNATEESESAVTPPSRRAVDNGAIPTPGVYDSYILYEDTVGCSDHCPVVLVLQV